MVYEQSVLSPESEQSGATIVTMQTTRNCENVNQSAGTNW